MVQIIIELYKGNVVRLYSNDDLVEYRIYDRDLPYDEDISPVFSPDEIFEDNFTDLIITKRIIDHETTNLNSE